MKKSGTGSGKQQSLQTQWQQQMRYLNCLCFLIAFDYIVRVRPFICGSVLKVNYVFMSILKLPEQGEAQREGCEEDGEEEDVEEDYVSLTNLFVMTTG